MSVEPSEQRAYAAASLKWHPAFPSTTLVNHHGLDGSGVIADRRAVVHQSLDVLEENFVTVVWAVPAFHCSVEAKPCVEGHVRLHDTRSERKAVFCKSLGLLREDCILVVEAVPALHRALNASVCIKSLNQIIMSPFRKNKKQKPNVFIII